MTVVESPTWRTVAAGLESLLESVLDDPFEAEAAVRSNLRSLGDCRLTHASEKSGVDGIVHDDPSGPLEGDSPTVRDGSAKPKAMVAAGRYGIELPAPPTAEANRLLRRICVWLTMIRSLSERRSVAEEYRDELSVVGELARHVLSVRDLDQVLLTITTETLRMSESDICGVFLRDGNELHMRSCVGNRLMETARLTMSPGQGVAGMVFETRAAAKVDSYLHDSRISQDFMSLAAQEETRAALAVPLLLGDDLIGVLEVWRRRYSKFTQRDVRRLEEFAGLVTIAIDNAQLYESQRAALTELSTTQQTLQSQVELLDETAQLQQSLIDIVLENGPVFAQVTRTLAEHLDCPAAVVASDGSVEAVYPRAADTSGFVQAYTAQRESLNRSSGIVAQPGGGDLWVHPIELGDDQFGAVCAQVRDIRKERIRVACSQAAVACALFHLQQRAASVARAEALDQVLWDLLDGSPEQRSAARDRAQQMGVGLRGWHRVLYGAIENLDVLATQEQWSVSETDRVRRSILRSVREMSNGALVSLASVRANRLVALVPLQDRDRSREFLRDLNSQTSELFPGVTIAWGLSTARQHPGQFPEVFAEARTALAAARRLGSTSLYDDLGIVRLLLGHEDADFQSFVHEITGPLQAYDEETDGSLMKTLRAYFDSNCSQKDAAEILFVHHKTLAYRLERIRKLTGLDLSQHSDRMRADLALRLLEVSEQADATVSDA